MKTPEEIKKGLKECIELDVDACDRCPYAVKGSPLCGVNIMHKDSLALIEQLEEQINLMKIQMQGDCGVCKHRRELNAKYDVVTGEFVLPDLCKECLTSKDGRKHWEYEGLPELPKKGES